MVKINVLDHQTIDQIAAGEVVERPASVVKELVENAIDAGADAVTVEIKEGGISLIRVTDNGSGIEKSQVGNAFLRHATSKISSADDLTRLVSLGFRGEALASIAAVSQVEMITKIPEELTGIRYVIEGGAVKEKEEVGAPQGTTIIVCNLFYNTPPRKKFLKQPQTEGSYVADLMEHLAMSNPKVSFKFLLNGQTKFYTTGSDDLREIVYRIYGKEIAAQLLDFTCSLEGMTVTGLLGKPVINRSNRSYEIFYINGRYIKSTLISKAVEEGYREYLMQHKFPFCILHFQVDTQKVDVNVHPSKMEVRIADGPLFYEEVKDAIWEALHEVEMIPEVSLNEDKGRAKAADKGTKKQETAPEPFEKNRIAENQAVQEKAAQNQSALRQMLSKKSPAIQAIYQKNGQAIKEQLLRQASVYDEKPASQNGVQPLEDKKRQEDQAEKPQQMELFDDRLLSAKAKEHYEIIGQLFETYWLISYQDKLLIVDQHAAHEKVKYERLMKRFVEKNVVSQTLNPPMIVTLNNREKECYRNHADDFVSLGFVIEEFGGNDYAIRGVPMDLYGYGEGAFFYEVLDELADDMGTGTPESVRARIAVMACKAAVKGNMRLNRREMEALIDELLMLDNPYHCPHGRPTIISMSRQEIEKKFKRIVN